MKNKRWWILVTLLAIAIGGLVYAVVSTSTSKNGQSLAAVLPTAANPYWQEMQTGIEKGTKKLPDRWNLVARTGSEDTDVDEQINILNTIINSRNIDALIIGPASSSTIVPTVKKYNKNDIPVIVVDSELDSTALHENNAHYEVFIGSRNRQGGMKAARRIEEYIGSGKHPVGIIGGSTGHQTAIARRNGFVSAAPNSWQIEIQNAGWDRKKANRVMRSFTQGDMPEAVFAASDQMALGAVDALKSMGIPKSDWPILVGFDATEAGRDAVTRGELCATIAQQPSEIGRRAVDQARKLITTERSETGKRIMVDTHVVPKKAKGCR